MSKRFRTCTLDQPLLLPPSLQDWLPEHHLARFIVDVVDELDLSKILSVYGGQDGRGPRVLEHRSRSDRGLVITLVFQML
jgi:transposase